MHDAGRIINNALEQARSGRLLPAIASLERLVKKRGAPPEAYHFLGMLQSQAGRAEPAVFNLERASRMAPGTARFESNFANVLASLGRGAEAERRYRLAVEADGAYAPARVGLAGLLHNEGRLHEALGEARRAVELAPESVDGAANLASCLIVTGDAAGAVSVLERAIERAGPGVRLNTLLAAARNYDAGSRPTQVLECHRTLGALHGAAARRFAGSLPALARSDPSGRLRVGYLSADFRDHPVGMFITPALDGDDRVEVFCYDLTARPDGANARMRERDVTWREARGLGDAELAAMVRGDSLDVLVELGGHTLGNRQTALAARMAPVQVSYLGYPATTGNPAIDARLVDGESDPAGAEAWCTERLVRLEGCAWCYTPPEDAPEVGPPPAGADGPVTFGSFNNLAKTGPGVVGAWARLLERVEGSRLVVKNAAFVDGPTREAVVGAFAARGVAPGRVEALAPTRDAAAHMAAYGAVDIALDTFPYAGTTTTCEALWMGVPVVTLAGEMHAGRVGVSLLRSVGLGACVASDAAGYVEIAAALASDRAALAETRRTLRARVRASRLMDVGSFRSGLHGALWSLARGEGGGCG